MNTANARAAFLSACNPACSQTANQIGSGNLVHLTIAYLALPMPFFLFGWLRLEYAIPLAVLSLGLLVAWGGEVKASVRPSGKSLAVCAAVAFVWVAMSGVGGFAYQNGDWIKHNAILHALVFYDWPVALNAERGTMLVYTIGYYLPAAAVGKLFGWAAANVALFVWTWAGVCMALAWFVHLAGGTAARSALMLAPLFVCLSGMDILHAVYHESFRRWLDLGVLIEWASGGKRFPTKTYQLQYSSMTTLLYWVPHHALPGWLGAALALRLKDEPALYGNAMLLGACVLLWSAFSAVGVALLFLVWFALAPGFIRAAFTPANVLLRQAGAALLALAVVLFIVANHFNIGESGYYREYLRARGVAFALSEFLLVGFAALILARGGQRRLLAAVCVALFLIPLYKYGAFNDMTMRASIPALFVFWCLVLRAFYDGRAVGALTAQAARAWIAAAILLGAVTPFMEVFRSLNGGDTYIGGKLRALHTAPDAPPTAGHKIRHSLSPLALERVVDFKRPDADKHFVARQYRGDRQSFFFRELSAE